MKCETSKYKALEKKNQEPNSVFSAAKVEEKNILFSFFVILVLNLVLIPLIFLIAKFKL